MRFIRLEGTVEIMKISRLPGTAERTKIIRLEETEERTKIIRLVGAVTETKFRWFLKNSHGAVQRNYGEQGKSIQNV